MSALCMSIANFREQQCSENRKTIIKSRIFVTTQNFDDAYGRQALR